MLILSVLTFFVAILLLALITVAIAWMGFVKRTTEQTEAARDEGEAGIADDSPLFRDERLSTLNFWDNLLARFNFGEILRQRLAEAELPWSVGRVTSGMLLCGTVAMLLAWKFCPGIPAMLVGGAVSFLPYGYVLRIREKRFNKFRQGFPDVLDSLARALRAGYPLSAAMELVAAEAQVPISVELKRTSTEANLGMGWPRALENLGRRVPLLEVNLFASAVALHARTGGKLSEVMSGLAENMREALALQGEVKALAAHGKMTGMILTILPIGIAFMMFMVSPEYMGVLIHHEYGKALIGGAITCLILAHVIIGKLVDIKL